MSSLFEAAGMDEGAPRPLADRLRPKTLEEVVGQDHLLGPKGPLGRMLGAGHLSSVIFWGPPGTGKTTIARLLADKVGLYFEPMSAIFSGVADLKKVFEAARGRRLTGKGTLLFVDEIHRFNKGQQDAFLQAIEDGVVTLLGATTENPSFEINNALLSRCRVFVLEPLPPEAIARVLDRAVEDSERGLGALRVELEPDARKLLAQLSGGDARTALNGLEMAAQAAAPDAAGARRVTPEIAQQALQRTTLAYDKDGEEHYNLISALHKAIRHSDPDASLYYLGVMMEGGEDPLFIARRLVRAASEDVGLADPQALTLAIAAKDTVDFLGYPECDVALAQVAVYLAMAPKSNAIYQSVGAVRSEIRRHGPKPVPFHYRNAPTKLMEDLGYGEGYLYDHDYPQKVSPQEAMPKGLEGRRFYRPGELGFEREIQKRLEYFAKVRENLRRETK